MRTTQTITLFTDLPELSQRSTSFVVSILIHCAALGVVSFGLLYTPRIQSQKIASPWMVRRLELRTPENEVKHTPLSAADYPGPVPPSDSHASVSKVSKVMEHLPVRLRVAHARPSRQTLLQPDVTALPTLTQPIPIPTVLLWSHSRQPARTIIAPLPGKPAATVPPSLELPNDADNLDRVSIAPSDMPMQNLPLQASSTSPISIPSQQQYQAPPATLEQTTTKPSAATVVSLSELYMANGTVILPPANESAISSSQNGAIAAAHFGTNGASSTNKAADRLSRSASDGQVVGADSQHSVSRIALPKNGQFGAVVVGASLEDEYPELAGLWSGRMAYTVYLHVGLAKSWILEYSLPRDADAAAGGAIARITAPWPYNIVRPNLAPGSIGADALMVRGFIDTTGHFQNLSVVFPQTFAQTQFVIDSLRQWQFRPAQQNGHDTAVDALLLIPDTE